MSFPKYPRYKDSGVEWLGEVPEHWEVKRLKRVLRLLTEKTDRRGNSVGLENIQSWTARFIPTESEFEGEGVAFERGDLLFGKLRPYLAKILVADAPGEAVGDFHVMRPVAEAVPEFAAYNFLNPGFISVVDGSTYGSKMPRASWDFVGSMVIPLPPESEQYAIRTVLDRETAKIDALIAEQQRLIGLLKEKRQAVISSAVIPRVDERTTKLRHLIEVTPGFAFPSDGFSEYGEGHRLLRGVNVGVGACRWDETVYWAQGVDARINEYQLNVGDLVLGMDRPWINEGTRIAQIELSDLPALLVQRVARIRAKAGSSLEFIRIVLASQAFQSYLEADLTGVSVPHISERQIVSFPVRALSFDDQVRIASTTMSSMSGIDNLIAESQRAITLLQERRTALISAAVTGKIDVRGIAMAEAA
jgi:type I restriction enzyme S subunit